MLGGCSVAAEHVRVGRVGTAPGRERRVQRRRSVQLKLTGLWSADMYGAVIDGKKKRLGLCTKYFKMHVLPYGSVGTGSNWIQVLVAHRYLPYRLIQFLSVESRSLLLRHFCRTSTQASKAASQTFFPFWLCLDDPSWTNRRVKVL